LSEALSGRGGATGRASAWLLLVDLEKRAHHKVAADAARLELAIRFAGAREGREAYDALGKKPKMDAATRFRLGEALYDAQRHGAAVAVLGGLAADDPHHCEATYMMARALEKQKDGAGAWKHFEEALACTGGVRADATFSGGRNRLRAGDLDKAKELLRAHVTEFPTKSTGDDALVMLAEAYRKSGEPEKADEVLHEAVTSYPDGDMLDQVTWDMVWPDIEAGRYQAALETVDRILASGRRETSYRAEGRMRYWRGRLLMHLARDEEARADFRQVLAEQPLSWYAVLAYSRLAEHDPAAAKLALNAAVAASSSPPDPLARIPAALWRDDHFQKAVELARMGLATEAQAELGAAPSVSGDEASAAIWTKVALFQVARGWHYAQRLARGREPELAKAWPRGAYARPWKLAHAMPYADLVEKNATSRGIDPYWVWSIMREESNFNPHAESWANAIGLMQIILPTAEYLAKGTDIEPTRENLQRPEVAIELGAKYLAKLIAQHPVVPLASAGYNAGGGAVNKWRRQFGDKDLDEFVERIPYDEARGYAKRVTRSVARYHWLYKGEMLTLPVGPIGAPE
ncbi:MAG: transglycosylase SLT domain-containing protein, partial [Myxococcales bacterium]|nr:transglycosylase SLT domain-containing protein [Myxococcales bacterium]